MAFSDFLNNKTLIDGLFQMRKKGWKPGRNFPESVQVWHKVLGQIIDIMLHFLITDLKSAPSTEKFICHNFCLIT